MRWLFRTQPQPEPVALYRYWDTEGRLLYVGITNDPIRRRDQHSRDATWWPFASQYVVEWHHNRAAARRAESKAIRRERPMFNVVHNGSNPHRVRTDRRRRQIGLYVSRNRRRRTARTRTYRRRSAPIWAITTWIVLLICAYALAADLTQ